MTHDTLARTAFVAAFSLFTACADPPRDAALVPPEGAPPVPPPVRPLQCDPSVPFSWQSETLGAVLEGRFTSKALAAYDLDGDGRDELAIATPDGLVEIWKRDPSAWTQIGSANLGGPVETVVIADVTHDGHADLVGGSGNDKVLRLARGTASGVEFEPVEIVNLPVPVSSITPFRSSGHTAVVVGAVPGSEPYSYATAWLLDSMPSGEPTLLPARGPFTVDVSFATGDFDRDGDDDLAGGGEWLENLGEGRFSPQTWSTEHRGIFELSVADFDGDDYLDLAAMESYSFRVYRNTGRSGFEQVWEVFQIYGIGTVSGRIDCDERPDLVGLAGQQRLQLFLGGTTGFESAPAHTVPSDVLGVRAGDFDGDGRIDLAEPRTAGACDETACRFQVSVLMAR